ncbi:hypothetical protein LOK49_LG13G01462 [Camellia lanceoleosa]|uniref:Uncharacterized protein n=1 Tax=Camellia lanceoleosa TaxID=1840588 RepID=A0ACC0FML8_9ERIC|nr:hypothetical protein LOK49_LG13G01462 [Camellia lanceoleosa]
MGNGREAITQLLDADPPFVKPIDLSVFRHFESSVRPPRLFVFGFRAQFKTQEEKIEEGKRQKRNKMT